MVFFVYSQTTTNLKINDFSTTNKKPTKLKKNQKIDLSNFPQNGIFFLEDVTFKDIVLDQKTNSPKPLTSNFNFDYKKIILKLFMQTNEDVIRSLAEKISPQYKNKNLDFLYKKVSQALTQATNKNINLSKNHKGIISEPLFSAKSEKGIVLRKADIVDVYDITLSNESQRMIDLGGNVLLYFEKNSLSAENVTINTKTKDIHGEGNVVLKIDKDILYGDRIIINLNKQVGYIFNVSGLQNELYFEGKLLRINRKGHYTIENGWITFSSNNDPTYKIESFEFDTYGSQKSIFNNSLIYIHNQPFFWIPYFIRYPVTTGLNLTFGETRRVGYYTLSSISFKSDIINDVNINFNVYEKLGLYFSFKNINKILNSQYTLYVIGAYYTDNQVTKEKPNKLTYSHNTSPYITSDSSLRHKIEYTHIFNLTEEDNKIKSDLSFSLRNVSDPYLTSTFPLNLSHFDLRKLIERHDRDESLYTPSATDTDHLSLKYKLAAPQTALGVDLSWNYLVYDDPNKIDATIDDRYHMYLSSMVLPAINFSTGGSFDPYRSDSLKSFHFNLGYRTSLSYNAKSTFKDGTAKGVGSGLLTNVEPYGLTKENYSLKLSATLNRSFSIDKDRSSIVNFNFDWFDWSIIPSLNYSLYKLWEGKDYTASDNKNDDRVDKSISYRISSGINFNSAIPTFFDMTINNSWSLSDKEIIFNYDREDIELGEDLTKTTELITSSYKFSVNMNFPSRILKSQWNSSYTYHSMLPTFILNLISYNVARNTSQEKIDDGKKFALDQYTSRSLSSSLSSIHNGYGFLYLNNLNYTLNSSVNFSYNLMPDKNENGDFINESFFDSSLWNENKITSFGGLTSWNFKYQIWNWNNKFNYIFYRNQIKKIDPLLINYSTSTSISYARKEPLNEWFSWKSSSVGFNWNYYFQNENYSSDSMSFSFQNNFDLLQLFNIAISFSSHNPNSELYFKNKADSLGKNQINFFEDIFASLGFLGMERQENALFKMGTTSISVWHDLEDWYLSFTYALVPVLHNTGSFRGFYFDHRISFLVNLKPDKDPRGPAEAANNPFFEKIEKDFTPEGFQNN